jgi:organic hydroperoxide reductase OsmC/OhrA
MRISVNTATHFNANQTSVPMKVDHRHLSMATSSFAEIGAKNERQQKCAAYFASGTEAVSPSTPSGAKICLLETENCAGIVCALFVKFSLGSALHIPRALRYKSLHKQYMAQYTAEVLWLRGDQDFFSNRYSRRHVLRFDGGVEFPGSSSPQVVPLPMSDATAVDPEESFVASLASCHMLWFLSIASRRKFCVDRYMDAAAGVMGKNSEGKMAMLTVTLKPEVQFSGENVPTREQLNGMHHEAHEACFIANSVKTEVRCEPVYVAL